MRLDPNDIQVALEYAFLCYESKQQAEARRIFDRIRRTGNAAAEQAFQNIDGPLAAGIERWQKAIALGRRQLSAAFRAGHPGRTARRAGAGRRALRKGLADSCPTAAPCWWIWAASGKR